MTKELKSLGWDYFMFVVFILFTVFAPLWKRIIGKSKQRSKADYVFATGGVSLVAVMLSIARGTLGVRTVLGYPSELFYYGSAMWEVIYGMLSAYPIVCFIFVPVYFNLGITSVYQYLDLRFKSQLVRCLASATYIVRQVCNLGITVYTPTVALSAIIGLPYWASIIGMSVICIFFTIAGGLKAAINADVIQTITIILVSVVVIIQGAISSGGPKRVLDLNQENGRLKFFNFTGDFTVRVDTTSAWLGQLFMSLSQFGCQQNFMQRYVSLKSLKEVNRAMMANMPIVFVFFSLSWLSGLVIYSTYVNCDPYAEGYIRKPDEILPFFVEDQLSYIPGFLGIFVASLFNGALCMMVSNLNSLATVCWEDFLSMLPQFKGLSDKKQLGIIRIITVIFGFIIMGSAFGVGLLSGVIESSMLAFSATSGPLLGCFLLAMLVPKANWKGTSAGMVSACVFVLWIIGGSVTLDNEFKKVPLPTSTEGCANFNFSESLQKPTQSMSWLTQHTPALTSAFAMLNDSMTATTTRTTPHERTPLETFYSISYMYYSLIGTAFTVVIGTIISYMTQDPQDEYDGELLHPLILKWSQRFSGNKPYFIKETSNDMSSLNVSQINRAFDNQSENNFNSNSNNDISGKLKSPIDAVFTLPQPNKEVNNSSNVLEKICSNSKVKLDSNIIGNNGTYRQFPDKEVA